MNEFIKVKNKIFTNDIEDPFIENWQAIAFDRDKYNNTRLPNHILTSLIGTANSIGESECIVCGGMRKFAENSQLPIACERIQLNLLAYESYFLKGENWSPEYFVFSLRGTWGVWADADVTVLGGAPVIMKPLVSELGGEESVVRMMQDEFALSPENHSDFASWLLRLLKSERSV